MCVCVCLSDHDHMSGNALLIFTTFSVFVTYGCGSVLHWRHLDMLHISSFVDNVIFAQANWLLDVTARLRQ